MKNKEIETYTIGQWIEDNDIDTREDIYCSHSNLTSLKGLPEGFNSAIFCSYNNLTSLEGLPEGFNSDIDCGNNNLTSLGGLPEGFNSYIDCGNNNITSLEGITNLDPKNLFCDWTQEQIEKEYLRLGLSSLLI